MCNTDPSNPMQMGVGGGDGMMGQMPNASPNQRAGTFAQPAQKNHRLVAGGQQSNVGGQQFQHPMSRPVSVQIPRQPQQMQQRITQSPFSPQPRTPQSPHDQYPLSPANSGMDQFSRPASECSQPDPYLNVSIFLLIFNRLL